MLSQLVPYARRASQLSSRFSPTSVAASFSTTNASSSSYSPVDWWRNRQEEKEGEKYKQKLIKMAHQEAWTVGDMLEELQEATSSWTAKMPVLKDSKEVQMATQLHKCLQAIADVTSVQTTDLESLTRHQKLQAASQAGTSVQDINQVVAQFTSMAILHKVLRRRQQAGRKIPETAQAVQTILQTEGQAVLSKDQKQNMAKRATQMMQRGGGRRRR